MSFWNAETIGGKSFHDVTNQEIFAVLREIVGENKGKPPHPETIHLVAKAIDSGDLVWHMDLKA